MLDTHEHYDREDSLAAAIEASDEFLCHDPRQTLGLSQVALTISKRLEIPGDLVDYNPGWKALVFEIYAERRA